MVQKAEQTKNNEKKNFRGVREGDQNKVVTNNQYKNRPNSVSGNNSSNSYPTSQGNSQNAPFGSSSRSSYSGVSGGSQASTSTLQTNPNKPEPKGNSTSGFQHNSVPTNNQEYKKYPQTKNSIHKVKIEETAEDIRADNARIEKEISLMISEIKNMKL